MATMRLWHKDLIPVLPRQQLLGQWRELCAIMRNIEEKGTPNHVLVNKVMDYPSMHLFTYALSVAYEMSARGYSPNFSKFDDRYIKWSPEFVQEVRTDDLFADWMNDRYLRQCYYNLEEKHDCSAISDEEFAKVREVCERVL